MPPHDPDREAELAALQTAFDEYIASSRELEDELDAELAKMREYNCSRCMYVSYPNALSSLSHGTVLGSTYPANASHCLDISQADYFY